MRSARSQTASRIAELTSLCTAARRKSRVPRYSPQVKVLVRALIESGVNLTELWQATNISKITIRKWLNTEGTDEAAPAVQVLTVSAPESTDTPGRSIVLSLKTAEFEVAVYSYDRVAS